jgi:pseudouridine kinase
MGGVGRNIAENLARLGLPTILLSAIGDDALGQALLQHTQASGVTVDYLRCVLGGRTGVYMSVLDAGGDQALALSDFEILHALDAVYIQDHAHLIGSATYVIADMCVPDTAIESLFQVAQQSQTRVMIEPTATLRAARLRPYLNHVWMLTPNAPEAAALLGWDEPPLTISAAQQAAQALVREGVTIAVITLGEAGLVYANSETCAHLPAQAVPVIETTGAGDALTAGTVYGLVKGHSLEEALQMGIQAASLTLACHENVRPDLSPALLSSASGSRP